MSQYYIGTDQIHLLDHLTIVNCTMKSSSEQEDSLDMVQIGFKNGITLRLYAETECCDYSWFEIMEGDVNMLVGEKLIAIELSDYIEGRINGGHDQNDTRILTITTRNNKLQLYFEHSSNGYYSGSLGVLCNIDVKKLKLIKILSNLFVNNGLKKFVDIWRKYWYEIDKNGESRHSIYTFSKLESELRLLNTRM